MATVTIGTKGKMVVLYGIETADAEDIFRGFDVREIYGAIEVSGIKVSVVRSKLRDAGHRTKTAA
jgi:hypothetical protein